MKEEFNYEVKDFVPTKRKKRKWKIIALILSVFIITTVGVAIIALKVYNSPEAVVASSLVDFYDHLIGEDSYVLENLDLKKFDKSLGDDNIEISSVTKLKQLGDMGLGGIEDFASGVSLRANMLVDWDKREASGDLAVGYSLFSVSLLQGSLKDHVFAVGSEKFFDEVFGAKIFDSMSQLSLPEHRLVKKRGSDKYEITALKEYVPNGDKVKLILTINKNREITKMEFSIVEDEDIENCEFVLDLTGKKHPTDKMELSGNISYKGQTYDIALTREVNRSGEVKKENVSVDLNLDGLKVNAQYEVNYSTKDNSLSVDFTGTDGVDVLDIAATGSIDVGDTIELEFDSINITYSDDFIAELRTSLELNPSKSKVKSVVTDSSKLIDVFELNEEIENSVLGQILKEIESYIKIFDSI